MHSEHASRDRVPAQLPSHDNRALADVLGAIPVSGLRAKLKTQCGSGSYAQQLGENLTPRKNHRAELEKCLRAARHVA